MSLARSNDAASAVAAAATEPGAAVPTAPAADFSAGDPPVFVTKQFLARYYHLPISAAAKELGVCTTMLKKMCRKAGVSRWPFRKIHSIDRMIASLERSLAENPPDAVTVSRELSALKMRREQIVLNPDLELSVSSLVSTTLSTSGTPQQQQQQQQQHPHAQLPLFAAAAAAVPPPPPQSSTAQVPSALFDVAFSAQQLPPPLAPLSLLPPTAALPIAPPTAAAAAAAAAAAPPFFTNASTTRASMSFNQLCAAGTTLPLPVPAPAPAPQQLSVKEEEGLPLPLPPSTTEATDEQQQQQQPPPEIKPCC